MERRKLGSTSLTKPKFVRSLHGSVRMVHMCAQVCGGQRTTLAVTPQALLTFFLKHGLSPPPPWDCNSTVSYMTFAVDNIVLRV